MSLNPCFNGSSFQTWLYRQNLTTDPNHILSIYCRESALFAFHHAKNHCINKGLVGIFSCSHRFAGIRRINYSCDNFFFSIPLNNLNHKAFLASKRIVILLKYRDKSFVLNLSKAFPNPAIYTIGRILTPILLCETLSRFLGSRKNQPVINKQSCHAARLLILFYLAKFITRSILPLPVVLHHPV